jgi:F-type H+-transporting ATPase subunit a
MNSKKKRIFGLACGLLFLAATVGGILLGNGTKQESIKEVMLDAVLHESNKVNFLGLQVNPSFISAVTVTWVLLFIALCLRLFVIPRFKRIPGRFQMMVEAVVGFFANLAETNSPHRNRFLGGYLFCAGVYIFIGTVFELFGLQAVTTAGTSITLPAPLSDINGAIAMGFLSYFIILSGGVAGNGVKGVGKTLKDFSLPISMSFRLFGALLSGLLVTELVYYYLSLSFVLPVIVGILFTLLHALIQTYVLVMLTSIFYGEVSEPSEKKSKKTRAKRPQAVA